MRLRGLGWSIVLAGLPWSHMLVYVLRPFGHLDLWHAHALWMQLGTLILLGGTSQSLGRLPSAAWWLASWLTGLALWIFTISARSGQPYPSAILLGTMNLWMVFGALLSLSGLTREEFSRVLQAVFWSGCVLVVYGWVQALNLDPFFHAIMFGGGKDRSVTQDYLVGTMGNPTHFACQLALWLPLAVIQPRWRKLWMLPAFGLLGMTSSATAVMAASVCLVAWMWRQSRRVGVVGGASLVFAGMGFVLLRPQWLNPFGRVEAWTAWWEVLKNQSIVGGSLGFVKYVTGQLPGDHALKSWNHLHNEYLQLWVEGGLVGLVLLGWMAWQLWQRRLIGSRLDIRWACGMCLVAFALISALSFPAHLWGLGMFGVLAMAGWMITTQDVTV